MLVLVGLPRGFKGYVTHKPCAVLRHMRPETSKAKESKRAGASQRPQRRTRAGRLTCERDGVARCTDMIAGAPPPLAARPRDNLELSAPPQHSPHHKSPHLVSHIAHNNSRHAHKACLLAMGEDVARVSGMAGEARQRGGKVGHVRRGKGWEHLACCHPVPQRISQRYHQTRQAKHEEGDDEQEGGVLVEDALLLIALRQGQREQDKPRQQRQHHSIHSNMHPIRQARPLCVELARHLSKRTRQVFRMSTE
jgi:hypothetical protein